MFARHGAVLAGGAGTRLGVPKPSADLAGRALVTYPIDALSAAGLKVVVVAKDETDLPAGVEAINEPPEPLHPLLGIVTALDALDQPIVVCACDMPFVTPDLVSWIAGRDDAPVVVPYLAGRLQPMFGRYSPQAVTVLRDALETDGSVRVAVETAGLKTVGEEELNRFGDPSRLLFDVDTPNDLNHAAEVIRSDQTPHV